MRSLSSRMNWALLGLVLTLLLLVGLAADHIAGRLAESELRVAHTHDVETVLATVRWNVYSASSARQQYILTGDESRLERFRKAEQDLSETVSQLEELTRDNAVQGGRIEMLEPLLHSRVELLEKSIALRKSLQADVSQQSEMTMEGSALTEQIDALMDAMREEEERLLAERRVLSSKEYERLRIVLVTAFAAVVLIVFATFRRLIIELNNRKQAEQAVRRLSSHILQLQDSERRRVARELHDGIGQYFAGLAMNLHALQRSEIPAEKKAQLLAQCLELVEQGMGETRTLSHLLHPPLLDEAGFTSAAKWYVEGFSQRSKIEVKLEAPVEQERMPYEIELVLFRVLQEGLTNIHRHSGSPSAVVRLEATAARAQLTVTDYGRGISAERLEQFDRTSTGMGVGLAGARERVSEIGGQFEVRCNGGTELKVTIPLPGAESSERSSGPAVRETNTAPDAKARPAENRTAGPDLLLGASQA